MKTSTVKIQPQEGVNIILGQSHFIKTVEDLYEVMVGTVPGIKFGLAFCEASGDRLVRVDGNDDQLKKLAAKPRLYEKGTEVMWTDPYISKQLLQMHINPDNDIASRSKEKIELVSDFIIQQTDKQNMKILSAILECAFLMHRSSQNHPILLFPFFLSRTFFQALPYCLKQSWDSA